MAARIITKLTSDKGQKWITIVLCTSCVGSVAIYYVPNTLLLHKYQTLFEMHRNGIPVPLEDDILSKFHEVLTDVKDYLPPRAKTNPFTAYGVDPISAGYVNTLQGAIVGIPSTFAYRNLNDIDENPHKILVEGRTLDPDFPATVGLKSSLILSDNAKKYAICREILLTSTPQIYFQSFYPSLIMISLNHLSYLSKRFLGIHNNPPVIRGMFYIMLTAFGFSLWFFVKDNTSLYYENIVEHKICALGQQYIQGGLEYYTKRLERNKALRELSPRGSSTYTVTGNETIPFRNKTIPLTVRQQFFQEQLDGINNDKSYEPM